MKISCHDLGSTGSSCQTPSRHLCLPPTLTRLISPLSAPTKKTNQSQVFTVKKAGCPFSKAQLALNNFTPILIRTVFRSAFRWARSSGGAWRAYHPGQRERQENPKAKINLFIVTNPTIGETLSKDTIFGIARKSRTGSQSWYHTNSGRATHNHFLSANFHVGMQEPESQIKQKTTIFCINVQLGSARIWYDFQQLKNQFLFYEKKVWIIEFSGNEHKWEKETVGNENAIKKNWV